MKKNTLKSAVAALAVSAVALSATAMTAFAGPAAGQEYDLKGLNPNNAAVKPTLTVSTETIKLEEAKANPTRNVTITVKGAADKYAPTGLHVQFDSRLKVVTKTVGGKVIYAKLGDAGEYLSQEQQGDGDNGFFLATAASDDVGQDGVLWSFQLTLPADVTPGRYPIEIAYKSKPTAEDLFTNGDKDEQGQLMQAYVFTQGITQGAIVVEGPTTSSSTTTTTTTSRTTTSTTTTSRTTTSSTTTSRTTTSSTSTSSTSSTSTSSTSTGSTTSTTSGSAKTTVKPTTTKAKTTGKAQDSAKTGVAGAGIAVAGLAIAVGTAFAFRKKED